MANTVTKTVILDGGRNLVVLVNISGDGSGEETNTLLVDRSAFDPVDGTELVIERVAGLVSGFTAALSFDALTDLVFLRLPDGKDFDHCWSEFAGVSSNKALDQANGDILLTTSGLGNGDVGTFILQMRKG